MSNPILSSMFGKQSSQAMNQLSSVGLDMPALLGLWNQIRKSPNPDAAMQNILTSDPRFQGVMNYINQNGGDARTVFYNEAAKMGADPERILSQLR